MSLLRVHVYIYTYECVWCKKWPRKTAAERGLGAVGWQVGMIFMGAAVYLDQRIFHSSRRYSFSVNLCGLTQQILGTGGLLLKSRLDGWWHAEPALWVYNVYMPVLAGWWVGGWCFEWLYIAVVVVVVMKSVCTRRYRGTLRRTTLRRVTPGLLFLWPIYRLLLLALCYYCYRVLFTLLSFRLLCSQYASRSSHPLPDRPPTMSSFLLLANYVEHSIGSIQPPPSGTKLIVYLL